MRLNSGIAPVSRYMKGGLTVGLGVDGSASNDSSNLLNEMRTALLLSRVTAASNAEFLSARNVLRGTVRKIELGAVNAQVTIEIARGVTIVSIITVDSVKNLGLVDGGPAAYVCRGFVCDRPVTTPDELAAQLGR